MPRYEIRSLFTLALLIAGANPVAAETSVAISDVAPERAGEPLTTSDLARIVDLEGLAAAPDGKTIAIQTRQANPDTNSYRLQWQIFALAGGTSVAVEAGEPLQIPPIFDPSWTGAISSEAPQWSADSTWFYYRRRDGDDIQIWRTRADGSVTEKVTAIDDRITAFLLGEQGELLFRTESNAAKRRAERMREGLSGVRYEGRFIPAVSHSPVIDAKPSQATDGKTGASAGAFHMDKSKFVRPATDKEAMLLQAAQTATLSVEREALTARAAVIDPEVNLGPIPPLRIEARLRGGKPIPCQAEACRGIIKDIGISGDGKSVYFSRHEGVNASIRSLYSWRIGDREARLVARDPSIAFYAGRCGFVADDAFCVSEEPDRPPYLARTSMISGETAAFFDPNRDIATFRHGPIKRLDVVNSWGQPAFAYLVLPPGYREGTRYPLVVVNYRAKGFQRGGVGDEYPVFPFAEAGIAVLAFDRPEAPWSSLEREPDVMKLEADEMALMRERRATLESIELAVSAVSSNGFVDRDKVAITGLSDGSETTIYAISHSKTFSAAIASAGGWTPAMGFLSTPERLRQLGLDSLHMAGEAYIADQSLALRAQLVCAPLLINVSESEFLPATEGYHGLRERARAVDMYVYPGEYHVKWQPAHRLAIYNRNIDWLNFWLRGVTSAESGEWAKMREQIPAVCRR